VKAQLTPSSILTTDHFASTYVALHVQRVFDWRHRQLSQGELTFVQCFIKGFAAVWYEPDTLHMNNLSRKERGLEMAKRNEIVKRVLLVIFFCLLMSGTANAQSGLVLWEQVQVMEVKNGALSENSQWTLLKAAPTPEQCIETQRQVFEVRKNDYTALKDSFPQMQIWTASDKSITVRLGLERSLISSVFHCLPGTTDPR